MSTSELSARLRAMTEKEAPKMEVKRSAGQEILASDAWKAFKSGDARRFGTTLKADFILGRTEAEAQTWHTETLPGIQSDVQEAEQHILDLMSVYSVNTPWVRYRRLTGYTRAAAVVPEKGKKPRAELTVGEGEATTYTIATGFDLTNQEIRDDADLVRLVDGLLRMDLREKLAALALKGSGSGEPLGIMNDPDIQTYNGASDKDILLAVRKAKDLLRRNTAPGSPTLLVSVEDAYKIDTMQLTNNGYLYAGSPYGTGQVPGIWGLPIVVSSEMEEGTALLAKFQAFDMRIREGIKVEAFEQHADYAEKNLVYVRAECDAGSMFRFPKAAVKLTLPANAAVGG